MRREVKTMDKKKTLKWVNAIAFAVLIVGGLNYLLMGLFSFDLFGAIFGGSNEVVSRLFYALFGFAALTLLGTLLWNMYMVPQQKTQIVHKTKTSCKN